MSSAIEHYSTLLAPVYLWMVGGWESALSLGTREVEPFCPASSPEASACDLGAGFGMHAIPLARAGYKVTAIDTSPLLLSALGQAAKDLPVKLVEANLLDFAAHLDSSPDLILCMGDTLTHLETLDEVEKLFSRVAQALTPSGRFVLTFRDYSNPPTGSARFIPVRSDSHRILTCFLEEAANHMLVHDLLYEQGETGWTMNTSCYRKLRLSPQWVVDSLRSYDFEIERDQGLRGMVKIVATRIGR